MPSQSRSELGLHSSASRISRGAFARCICSGLQVKSLSRNGWSARGAQASWEACRLEKATRSNNGSCSGHAFSQGRAHSTTASHRHRDLPDKSFQVRSFMPSHLYPRPATGSRMPARVLTSCCDPIVAGSTESIASVIRTTRPSLTPTRTASQRMLPALSSTRCTAASPQGQKRAASQIPSSSRSESSRMPG